MKRNKTTNRVARAGASPYVKYGKTRWAYPWETRNRKTEVRREAKHEG
jgi:hypothetical protein